MLIKTKAFKKRLIIISEMPYDAFECDKALKSAIQGRYRIIDNRLQSGNTTALYIEFLADSDEIIFDTDKFPEDAEVTYNKIIR